MPSLSDKAGIVILGRMMRALINLGLALIVVRLLTTGEYGSYRQVFLGYETLAAIFFLGIPTSIFYFLPRATEKAEKQLLVFQSALSLFVIGAVLALAFYLGAEFLARSFNNPRLSALLRAFALYPAFEFPINILPPVFISLDRHKHAAMASVLFGITFAAPIVALLAFGCSLETTFQALVWTAAGQFVVVGFILARIFGIHHASFEFNSLLQQLKYSVPAGMSGVVTLLTQYVDKYFISVFFLPSVFAIYSVGARELPFVNIIPYAVSSVLFPRLTKLFKDNDAAGFIKVWHGAIRKTTIVLVPMAPLFFVLAAEVIGILYTSTYLESTVIFQIYLLTLPLRVTAFNSVLLAMGKPRMVLWGTFGSLLFNATLNYLFIREFGMVGPAIATVISTIGLSLLFMIIIARQLQVDFSNVLPWKIISKTLIVAVLAALPIPLIKEALPNVYLTTIIGIATFSCIYLLLGIIFRLIQPDDIAQVKRWIRMQVSF